MDGIIDYKNNEWWWWNCILQSTAAISNAHNKDDFIITFIDFYDEWSLPPSTRRGKRKVKIIYDAYDQIKKGMGLL